MIWKDAGRPRSGPVFNQFRKDNAAYKHGIRARQRDEKEVYTNELHDALLKKHGIKPFGTAGPLNLNLLDVA